LREIGGIGPVKAMLVMLKVVLPVLFRVMACAALVTPTAWLAKLRLLGERLRWERKCRRCREADGLGATGCIVRKGDDSSPGSARVGLKVTLIVQLVPAETELPHVLVCAKSLALVP